MTHLHNLKFLMQFRINQTNLQVTILANMSITIELVSFAATTNFLYDSKRAARRAWAKNYKDIIAEKAKSEQISKSWQRRGASIPIQLIDRRQCKVDCLANWQDAGQPWRVVVACWHGLQFAPIFNLRHGLMMIMHEHCTHCSNVSQLLAV